MLLREKEIGKSLRRESAIPKNEPGNPKGSEPDNPVDGLQNKKIEESWRDQQTESTETAQEENQGEDS
jgi:hypothetical protein